jgi:HSP20 family protein
MRLDLNKWNPFRFLRNPGNHDMRRSDSPPPATQAGGLVTDRWFGDFSGPFQPSIDVVDDGDAIRISAEMPGMGRDEVEVEIDDDVLVIRGEKKLERKSEEKGCYHVERAFGAFQRLVPLPIDVDAARAETKFENGTLTIRMPKAQKENSASRKLQIQ